MVVVRPHKDSSILVLSLSRQGCAQMRSDACFQFFRIFPQERRISYERELFFVFSLAFIFISFFLALLLSFFLKAPLLTMSRLVNSASFDCSFLDSFLPSYWFSYHPDNLDIQCRDQGSTHKRSNSSNILSSSTYSTEQTSSCEDRTSLHHKEVDLFMGTYFQRERLFSSASKANS